MNITCLLVVLLSVTACKITNKETEKVLSDGDLIDLVQKQTFNYFWEGAEPVSGLACERINIDGVYPQNDRHVVTSGGSGFGLMAILAGIDRGDVSREEGLERMTRIVDFLEKADCFHGVWPHWWYGNTGKVKPFSPKDDGGDLVETAFLVQALLCLHQYYLEGNEAERKLAMRIDKLWREVEWDWYQNDQHTLFWHWSPNYGWEMDFPVRGYNECLVMYILAASSPTHGVSAEVYHDGWAQGGKIVQPHEVEGYSLQFRHQGTQVGPLFWAHYSFLGLDPRGLKDQYGDYWQENKNHTLINRAYSIRNPKHYKGYGADCWGMTASYSVKGYHAHTASEENDMGVISPTASLSSIAYTPEYSLEVLRNLYQNKRDKVWGKYGFYDAFSDTEGWYPQQYLAIDQGPLAVMMENYRSGLLWKLFMSHPDIQNGLKKLGFQSPWLTD